MEGTEQVLVAVKLDFYWGVSQFEYRPSYGVSLFSSAFTRECRKNHLWNHSYSPFTNIFPT